MAVYPQRARWRYDDGYGVVVRFGRHVPHELLVKANTDEEGVTASTLRQPCVVVAGPVAQPHAMLIEGQPGNEHDVDVIGWHGDPVSRKRDKGPLGVREEGRLLFKARSCVRPRFDIRVARLPGVWGEPSR